MKIITTDYAEGCVEYSRFAGFGEIPDNCLLKKGYLKKRHHFKI